MNIIKKSTTAHNELFAVTTFIRNSAQPKPGTAYNVWLTRGLGKIGVIQHGSNIPDKAAELMVDPECISFNAITRVVQEINPGQNSGTLLLHIISVVEKSKFNFLNCNAFTSTLRDGSVILELEDEEMREVLLWAIAPEIRSEILVNLNANLVIPNVAECVRRLADNDSELKSSLTKSDLFLSYMS